MSSKPATDLSSVDTLLRAFDLYADALPPRGRVVGNSLQLTSVRMRKREARCVIIENIHEQLFATFAKRMFLFDRPSDAYRSLDHIPLKARSPARSDRLSFCFRRSWSATLKLRLIDDDIISSSVMRLFVAFTRHSTSAVSWRLAPPLAAFEIAISSSICPHTLSSARTRSNSLLRADSVSIARARNSSLSKELYSPRRCPRYPSPRPRSRSATSVSRILSPPKNSCS